MDDIQLLIYLALIGFGIFSRFLKAKKAKPRPQAPADQQGGSKERPLTFDELLKEFTSEPAKAEKELEEVEASEYEEVYESQPAYVDTDEAQARYEQSVKTAQELQTIDQLVDLEDDRHTGNFKHFRGYETHEEPEEEHELVKFIKSEGGARKAIILSEILNRKY